MVEPLVEIRNERHQITPSKGGAGSLRPDQGSQRAHLWMGSAKGGDFFRDVNGAEGPLLEADSHLLLSSQFTQSALDCMSVEVGRLRAFLQVRAQSDLLEFLFLCSPHFLAPSPNSDLASHLSPVMSRVGRRLQILPSCSGTWKLRAVIPASSARRSGGGCQGRTRLGSRLHWPLDHRFRAVKGDGKETGSRTRRGAVCQDLDPVRGQGWF